MDFQRRGVIILALQGLVAAGALGLAACSDPIAERDQAILASLKTYRKASVGDARAMGAELQQAGFDELFANANLAADPDLSASTAKVARIKAILGRYRALEKTRRDEARARLDQAGLNERAVIFGRDRLDEIFGRQSSQRYWGIYGRIVEEAEKLVGLLKATRGRWRIKGDDLVFDRQGDLDRFRAQREMMDAYQGDLSSFIREGRQDAARRLQQ
jgi:hypothetical protein